MLLVLSDNGSLLLVLSDTGSLLLVLSDTKSQFSLSWVVWSIFWGLLERGSFWMIGFIKEMTTAEILSLDPLLYAYLTKCSQTFWEDFPLFSLFLTKLATVSFDKTLHKPSQANTINSDLSVILQILISGSQVIAPGPHDSLFLKSISPKDLATLKTPSTKNVR